MLELTAQQAADYAKLKGYYPYRMFFLVTPKGAAEAVVWALRDRRAVNKVLREGGTVLQIN